MDRPLRKRHGTEKDEWVTPIRETDHAELATVRTVKENKTLMEKCEICKGIFKKRGLKIHQAKSKSCKRAANRMQQSSKSKAGGFQEPHHSDSPCESRPKEFTPIFGEIPKTSKEEERKRGTMERETISQEITRKLREVRREMDILVVDDENECRIRSSIVQESLSPEISKKLKEVRREMDVLVIDDDNESKIRNSIVQEDKETKSERVQKIREKLKRFEFCSETANTNDERVIETFKMKEDERRVINSDLQTDLTEDQRVFEHLKEEERKEKSSSRYHFNSAGTSREHTVKFVENKHHFRKIERSQEKSAEQQWKEVFRNINCGEQEEVIGKGKFSLKRGDLKTLAGTNWLNDQILEEYFALLKARNDADQTLPHIEVLSSFVFKKFDLLGFEDGFKDLKNWYSPNITEADIILVPIHKDAHWTLIEVNLKSAAVVYYDSITSSRFRSKAPTLMKRFIERVFEDAGTRRQFKIKINEQAPVQRNGVDCGVFVCQNAEKIARGVPVNTKQEEMKSARRRMLMELVEGNIIPQKDPVEVEKLTKILPGRKIDVDPEKQHKPNDTRRVIEKRDVPKLKKKRMPERPERDIARGDSRKVDIKSDSQGHQRSVDYAEKEKSEEIVPRIKWPKSNSKEWQSLEVDIASRLKVVVGSPLEKAKIYPKLTYQMCKERFGIEDKARKKMQSKGPSRRQRKCSELRKEIKKLKKAFREASESEKEGIQQLQDEKLKSLRLKKRAESLKKNRKEFSQNCNQFLSQPYQFSRKIINPKPKGDLKSSKEEVEAYLEKVHSYDGSHRQCHNAEEMLEYPEPELQFKSSPPSYKEFCKKLRKTRTKSAPGPNGVPYRIYKKCPDVARLLWQNLCELWKRNQISDTWREANGVFIPKEEGATAVEKFRTISLLNVEGKLFFALKADRILDFVLTNKYMDTSIQKGGIPATSGCLENTAVLSQLIREAKTEKKILS